MKKLFAGLLSALMAFTLMMPMSAVFAEGDGDGGSSASTSNVNGFSSDSTADLVLTNAEVGDTFVAYKLIDITYDAATNQLSYTWNEDFAECMANLYTENGTEAVTVETYRNASAERRRQILAQLNNYIATNSTGDNAITAIATAVANDDGKATFVNFGLGGYFIMPTSASSVYQYIFKSVEPVLDDAGEYKMQGINFSVEAKHNTIGIDKTVKYADDTDSDGKEDMSAMTNTPLKYTIIADVPLYGANALDKMFSITDDPEESITITENTIKVYARKTDGTWDNLTDNNKNANDAYYTLTTKETDGIITDYKIEVKNTEDNKQFDNWYSYTVTEENGEVKINTTARYEQIKIEYEAILNDKAQLAKVLDNGLVESNSNVATITFYPYPYVKADGKIKTSIEDDKVDVYTYGIKIFKYGDGDTENKLLSGAEFKLYSDSDAIIPVTNYYYSTNNATWTLLSNDSAIATENGYLYIKGLAEGTYYLKETKAPNGYNLPDNDVVTINVTTKDKSYELNITSPSNAKAEAKKGNVLVEINNSSGFTLPATGGTGVLILKILGVVAMAMAVVVITVVLIRPKKKTEK